MAIGPRVVALPYTQFSGNLTAVKLVKVIKSKGFHVNIKGVGDIAENDVAHIFLPKIIASDGNVDTKYMFIIQGAPNNAAIRLATGVVIPNLG